MSRVRRTSALSVVFILATSVPTDAQPRTGLMRDLIARVSEVETKVVGLAKAMPESAYDWRPGSGVRSTSEVFIHVAADNYFAAAKMGTAVPAETSITGRAYAETRAYEARTMTMRVLHRGRAGRGDDARAAAAETRRAIVSTRRSAVPGRVEEACGCCGCGRARRRLSLSGWTWHSPHSRASR
jgi:hypothetical protein